MVILVVAVVVSAGGRGSRSSRGRCGGTVVPVAGLHGGRSGCGSRQVVSHGRVVRPGGHGRGGAEPVRGVRHLTAGGQVTVSHGRVVHVGRGRGAGQTVEVGLVQVRVVHVRRRGVRAVRASWVRVTPRVISSNAGAHVCRHRYFVLCIHTPAVIFSGRDITLYDNDGCDDDDDDDDDNDNNTRRVQVQPTPGFAVAATTAVWYNRIKSLAHRGDITRIVIKLSSWRRRRRRIIRTINGREAVRDRDGECENNDDDDGDDDREPLVRTVGCRITW